jgi:hypothetical protein
MAKGKRREQVAALELVLVSVSEKQTNADEAAKSKTHLIWFLEVIILRYQNLSQSFRRAGHDALRVAKGLVAYETVIGDGVDPMPH